MFIFDTFYMPERVSRSLHSLVNYLAHQLVKIIKTVWTKSFVVVPSNLFELTETGLLFIPHAFKQKLIIQATYALTLSPSNFLSDFELI